jgi:hypothetical protein
VELHERDLHVGDWGSDDGQSDVERSNDLRMLVQDLWASF